MNTCSTFYLFICFINIPFVVKMLTSKRLMEIAYSKKNIHFDSYRSQGVHCTYTHDACHKKKDLITVQNFKGN